jgi:hypothetical protein
LVKKDIGIATITETKRELEGSKESRNCFQFYSGFGRKVRAEMGVVLLGHKRIKQEMITIFTEIVG